MKIIRSTSPIPLGRKNVMTILVMAISIEWQEHFSRWFIRIKEYTQVPVENPQPGTALFSHIPKFQEDGKEFAEKIKTPEQVDALFSHFNITIGPGDSFTQKFRQVIALAGIYENQVNPPYTLNPADFEIVNTEDEIVPAEPIPPQ